MASSFLVSSFVPFLLLLLYVVGIYGVPFDLYKRRYDIQKSTINSTFFRYDPTYINPFGYPGPYWKSLHPEYINATFNAVKALGKTFTPADEVSFREYIGLNATIWGTVMYWTPLIKKGGCAK